ncbi:ABC transporter ATP-binding protein [Halorarius halobius]|uniref:ABC transporter ATP-binding protein n=1 Tax=Halorarius halobius TaxID=2962671 RepID=UPI0020CFDB91|nr:oligopeptide/dipeptide ABC transporter ATP-binding protein [Halorarius halobius]
MTESPLLSVRDLEKHYPVRGGLLGRQVGAVRAVDGIDLELHPGETVGLVGESGCGKSTAAEAILHLDEPTGGEVRFDDERVGEHDDDARKQFRRRASMVFQDPDGAFDPRMTVGEAIAEPLRIHGMRDADRRREIVADLVERVGLSPSDTDRYPHEFSGGQKQRLALARALVTNPDLLVADEPVSALDVSIQAEILGLVDDLQAEFDLSVLFISHDMGVVRQVCDRVAVMYLGEIVEVAPTEELFAEPQHPYTRALLSSVPTPDPDRRGEGVELGGDVPDPQDPPDGCRFHTRCPEVIAPDRLDLPQETFRAVTDLRVALREGTLDREGLRTECVAEGQADDASAVDPQQVAAMAREEYDVPADLSDETAEQALAEGLAAFADGDDERARDLLAETFASPCEERTPELQETGAGHPAACHLHD